MASNFNYFKFQKIQQVVIGKLKNSAVNHAVFITFLETLDFNDEAVVEFVLQNSSEAPSDDELEFLFFQITRKIFDNLPSFVKAHLNNGINEKIPEASHMPNQGNQTRPEVVRDPDQATDGIPQNQDEPLAVEQFNRSRGENQISFETQPTSQAGCSRSRTENADGASQCLPGPSTSQAHQEEEDHDSDGGEAITVEGEGVSDPNLILPHRCRSCSHAKKQMHTPRSSAVDLVKDLYGLPMDRLFYVCFHCATAFPCFETLNKHLETSHDNLVCRECSGTTVAPRLMQTHSQQHFSKNDFISVCSVCKIMFKKEGQLLFHLVNSHGVPMVHVCKGCKMGTHYPDAEFTKHVMSCEFQAEDMCSILPMHQKVAIMPTASLSYQPDSSYFKLSADHPELIAHVSSCPNRSLIRFGDGVFTCPEIDEKNGNQPCFVLTHFLRKKSNLNGPRLSIVQVEYPYFDEPIKNFAYTNYSLDLYDKVYDPWMSVTTRCDLPRPVVQYQQRIEKRKAYPDQTTALKIGRIENRLQSENVPVQPRVYRRIEVSMFGDVMTREDRATSSNRKDRFTNEILRECLAYDPRSVCFFCGQHDQILLNGVLRSVVAAWAECLILTYDAHYAFEKSQNRLSTREMAEILNFRLGIAGEKAIHEEEQFSICMTHVVNSSSWRPHAPGLSRFIIPKPEVVQQLQVLKQQLQKEHADYIVGMRQNVQRVVQTYSRRLIIRDLPNK